MPKNIPIAKSQTDDRNRGLENQVADPPIKINLTGVDEAIFSYITEVIKPQITVEGSVQPVKVLFANQERWKSIQSDGYLREEKTDKAQTPLIVISRTGVVRSELNNPNNKYLYTTFESRWNKKNIYDRFAAVNGIKPSQKIRNVIVPDYVELSYEIIIWTDFQEHMNQIIEQINVEADEYWGFRNQFKFRVKIDGYNGSVELPPTDIRMVRNNFNMSVEAYLVPDRVMLKYKPINPNTDVYTTKKVITITETTGSL